MKTRDLPGISVLLPVYFRHISVENIRLLRGSLESVVGQRYSGPLEILVIDDGSPCPVESFAEDLGAVAKMVRWIRLPYNRGIVFALNAGIETARHDFLARIDADDRWLPGKLDVQIEQLLADPDLTLIATGMTRVNADGTVLDTHIRPGDWSGILRFFIEQGCPFPHGSVIGKRQVYRILGGYPHTAAVRHCEDYALWEIWLRFFKPAMVESALYEYRVSGTSVSVEHSLQQFRAAEVIRRSAKDRKSVV